MASADLFRSASNLRKRPKSKKIQPVKWVPDEKSPNCNICHREFSIRRRRHHCRKCGNVVCGSCSTHTMVLNSASDPVRVCDQCYATLSEEAYEDVLSREITVEQDEDVADPRLKEQQLPPWTYALRPFSKHGKLVGIGRLYIKVVNAENLPILAQSGSLDAFCVLTLGDEKKTTKTGQTTSPNWNEEFLLNVVNVDATLKIEIFNQDRISPLIGKVNIPLTELSHQKRFSSWYELQLTSEAERRHKMENKERKETKDGEGSGKPRLRLEIQYTFSKVGEFFSFFEPQAINKTPASETGGKSDEFDIETMYQQSIKLQNMLGPLYEAFQAFLTLLRTPSRETNIIRVCLLFLAFFPWTITLALQILLLRYIIWQYIYRVWVNTKQGLEDESEQKETPTLSGTVHVLTVNALSVAGVVDQLGWSQKTICSVVETLETFKNYLQWKDPTVTARIVFGLCCTIVYSCFYPHAYLFIAVVVWVLTYKTATAQSIRWWFTSVQRYWKKIKHRRGWSASVQNATTTSSAYTSTTAT